MTVLFALILAAASHPCMEDAKKLELSQGCAAVVKK